MANRSNPISLLALLFLGVALFGMMRGRALPRESDDCVLAADECLEGADSDPRVHPLGTSETLAAEEACSNAGYLCAELDEKGELRVQRWKGFSGTLVVHVPRPDFEDSGDAIALQRAAAQGVRAWNNEPFPILADTRGERDAHVTVQWSRALGGNQLGVARTRWSPTAGLSVVSIELATRNPFRSGQVADPGQIRLTAAHEMGHALGLPHSDSSRDVMYPTNTATSVSAQDRRTMEVLYELDDGTRIVR